MKTTVNHWNRWSIVCVYAIAMAWVESAVVYYLRTMVDRIEPYQPNPLPIIGNLGPVELAREAATLIMLATVGILAGRTMRSRTGYALVAFGVWDIFYYAFLKLMTGWPHSWLDWDVLFLLPLPWWGPVWAPVGIALLMIGWGTLASRAEGQPIRPVGWRVWLLSVSGTLLALYVFMTDTWQVAGQGVEAIRTVLPEHFNAPLFCAALALMSVPLIQSVWRLEIWPPVQRSSASVKTPAEQNSVSVRNPMLACKRSP